MVIKHCLGFIACCYNECLCRKGFTPENINCSKLYPFLLVKIVGKNLKRINLIGDALFYGQATTPTERDVFINDIKSY